MHVREYQESKKPLSLIVTIKLTKEISVLTISLPRELYMTSLVKTLPAQCEAVHWSEVPAVDIDTPINRGCSSMLTVQKSSTTLSCFGT